MLNLAEFRKSKNLMQKEVAKGIGMNAATYCRKEKENRRFTVDEVESIVEFFGMRWEEVNDVFFGGRLKCGERAETGKAKRKRLRFKKEGNRYIFVRE